MNCRHCTLAALSLTLVGAGALTLGLSPLAPPAKPSAPAAPAAPAAKPATSPAAPASPAKSGPVDCTVDAVHSRALFRVHHLGASQFWGRFNAVSGTFNFTPGTADGMKFDITIKTDSIDTGVEDLDKHLRSPDFFAAKDFPEMKFVSTSARKTGDNMYDVTGTLTIRGTSKPITAKLEYTGMGTMRGQTRAGFEATFTVKRSEFGVSYGTDNGALGDDTRVVVCLEGNAAK
jgi:polyisoprenoid-binding protein YceI